MNKVLTTIVPLNEFAWSTPRRKVKYNPVKKHFALQTSGGPKIYKPAESSVADEFLKLDCDKPDRIERFLNRYGMLTLDQDTEGKALLHEIQGLKRELEEKFISAEGIGLRGLPGNLLQFEPRDLFSFIRLYFVAHSIDEKKRSGQICLYPECFEAVGRAADRHAHQRVCGEHVTAIYDVVNRELKSRFGAEGEAVKNSYKRRYGNKWLIVALYGEPNKED